MSPVITARPTRPRCPTPASARPSSESAEEPNINTTPDCERVWCLRYGVRAVVEVETVAERIERMLMHPHPAACPVPPGIASAGIRPEAVQ